MIANLVVWPEHPPGMLIARRSGRGPEAFLSGHRGAAMRGRAGDLRNRRGLIEGS